TFFLESRNPLWIASNCLLLKAGEGFGCCRSWGRVWLLSKLGKGLAAVEAGEGQQTENIFSKIGDTGALLELILYTEGNPFTSSVLVIVVRFEQILIRCLKTIVKENFFPWFVCGPSLLISSLVFSGNVSWNMTVLCVKLWKIIELPMLKMVYSCGSQAVDGPAIIQLRKWDSTKLDLSKFCEAFISPTRELLLLLSHQCEASLLPLTGTDELGGCYDSNSFSSSKQTTLRRLNSLDNTPSTSGSVEGVPSLESTSPRSEDCSLISDVKSLAWGHYGDAYDQHKDVSFREFLFVSGDCGITVHAFCHMDGTHKSNQNEDEVGQGRWVEWGPETLHKTHANRRANLYGNDSENFLQGKTTPKRDGRSHDVDRGQNGELSMTDYTLKKWLKTFYTKVETVELEGDFCTRFPVKPSYPSSVEIVSFSMFENTSMLVDFLTRSDVSYIEKSCNAATVPQSDASVISLPNSSNPIVRSDDMPMPKVLNPGSGSSFKCFKLFSSSSHRLIGFALALLDPRSVKNSEETVRSTNKVFVVVTKIYQERLQWVSSSKLHSLYVNIAPEFEWTDFIFSDDLLVCLHASGLIFVHGAEDGKLVKRFDILKIHGLGPKSNLLKQEKLSVEDDSVPKGADVQTEQDKIHNTCTKRHFKKLMGASSSSLLAAVDDHGVIYIIFPGDYISDKSLIGQTAPTSSAVWGRSLIGWEIGVSSSFLPVEFFGYWRPSSTTAAGCQIDKFLTTKTYKEYWPLWKIEVLDRVLLYESPEAADHLCSENGWDLKIARLRRLQLALDYLKVEEIEQSLEMLVDVNIAEEGILRILFTAVYQAFCKVGSDNEVVLASRLLSLAASFANQNDRRNMQCRVDAKRKRPAQGLVGDADESKAQNQSKLSLPASKLTFEDKELALMPIGSFEPLTHLDSGNINELSIFSSRDNSLGKNMIPLENPKDMIARWEIDNLDLKTVVNDALHSGRLPLAVLQLHIQRVRDLVSEKEHHDIFTEIRDVGRTIAYDLFLKGDTGLAVATLQRLGEDIETSLKQLLFGSV
ncbi:hypothetical protein IFM89_032644, partial [Coptis chinensis]